MPPRLRPHPSQTKAIHTHRHFPLTSKTTSSSKSGVILLRHATRLSTMGNEGEGTGGTQASASSVPCVQKTTTPSMPRSHAPFSGPLIGAEDDPVDGRGGRKRKLEPSDWRRPGLLSAFYGCDWQGAPGALIFFFFFGARDGHAPGGAVNSARARRLWLAPGSAAGSLESSASFVPRSGCAAGQQGEMWTLRELFFSA